MGMLRSFTGRPRLLAAMAIGIGVALALGAAPDPFRGSTRAILAWDAACFTFIASVMIFMAGRTPGHIRSQAAQDDEGRGLILGLVVIAAAASLGAIGAEVSLAKGADGLEKAARVSLAAVTVAASWFVVQLIFTLHYAHEYYSPDESGGDAEGLAFPGGEPPDYWDFLHFATVIGVAAQTADIAFTAKSLRRIGTVHGLVAFLFNTVVLALTINLLAGLFA